MITIKITKKSANKIKQGHLWIFSGAIESLPELESGTIVRVVEAEEYIATGYYSKQNDIAIRIISFKDEEITEEWWKKKIKSILVSRQQLFVNSQTNTYRLINSEGDFLPGLIIDKYADYVVMQISTTGIEKIRSLIIKILEETLQPKGIYIKNNLSGRKKEDLTLENIEVGEIIEPIEVLENNLKFLVDIKSGQKTGFFIDQREKRLLIKEIASKKTILNLFSYTAGFGLAGLKGGALKVVNIDQSKLALARAKEIYLLNGLEYKDEDFIAVDIFDYIQNITEINENLIIVDPPALAKTKYEKIKAIKAYTSLNRQILTKVKIGTIILTCSCSNVISELEFRDIISAAAYYSNRKISLLKTFTQDIDHPLNFVMPETNYLKCLLLKVEV